LESFHAAVSAHVDITLFVKLLLERMRLIMLLRNKAAFAEDILAQYADDEQTHIKNIVAGAGALNSHMLLRMLAAAEQLRFAAIAQLPIELAIIEVTEQKP
jgi:hypothetical protein